MKKGDIFPVFYSDRKHVPRHVKGLGENWNTIKAEYTGEKRKPRKGEWFLSGADVEAYYAPDDLNSEYHIARLVITKKVEVVAEIV